MQLVPGSDRERAEFVRKVIQQHQSNDLYCTAKIADDYDRCRNTTTMMYQKMITDLTGQKYIDQAAAVHRSCSNFFNIFTTQENQYLLGNGVNWKNAAGERLGKDFDTRLQQAGKAALVGGVSFGFWNLDHLEVFKALEFAPLYDEENGALAAEARLESCVFSLTRQRPIRPRDVEFPADLAEDIPNDMPAFRRVGRAWESYIHAAENSV